MPTWLRLPPLILLPFLAFLVSWYYNGSQIPYLVGAMLLLLAWGFILLWRRIGQGLPLPSGKLPAFMLLWFVWYLCTLLWTSIPYTSWFYFWMLGCLPLGFLFWLLQDHGDKAWRQFWPLLVLSAAGLAGWGIWEYFQDFGRTMGPLLDFNSYAAFINLLFFPILARFFLTSHSRQAGEGRGQTPLSRLRERGWGRGSVCSYAGRLLRFCKAPLPNPLPQAGEGTDVDTQPWLSRHIHWPNPIYLTVLAALLFALFTTISRGATLAWLLVLPLALWSLRRQPYFRRKALAVLLLAASAFAVTNHLSNDPLSERLGAGYIQKDDSALCRLMMWESAWHIYQDYPTLGTGLGTYFIYYPAYRKLEETCSAGTYAHNDYIQFLQEGGPINLAWLLAFVGIVLAWSLRQLRAAAAPPSSPRTRGSSSVLATSDGPLDSRVRGNDAAAIEASSLTLAVLCISLQATVNFIFYNLPITLLSGLFLARAWQLGAGAGLDAPVLPRIQIRASMARMVLVLILAFPAGSLLLDNFIVFWPKAWIAKASDSFGLTPGEVQLRLLEVMTGLKPNAIMPPLELGNTYSILLGRDLGTDNRLKPEILANALSAWRLALRGNPRSTEIHNAMAKLILKHAQHHRGDARKDAEQLLKTSLGYNPIKVDSRVALSQIYFDRGETERAYQVLQDGMVYDALMVRNWLPLREALADAAMKTKRSEEATALALEILTRYPSQPEAIAWLRQIWAMQTDKTGGTQKDKWQKLSTHKGRDPSQNASTHATKQ